MVITASFGQCFGWMSYHILSPRKAGEVLLGFKMSCQQDGMMPTYNMTRS